MGLHEPYGEGERPAGREHSKRRVPSFRARRQRALARELRSAVAAMENPPELHGCQLPMLLDRVQTVRPELLELADQLDGAADHNPTRNALVRELLRDGGSPLYDRRVPEHQLHELLARARSADAIPPGPAERSAPGAPASRRRRAALPLGALGLAVVVALAGTAAAANRKSGNFTEKVIAVAINADGSQSVAKIQDSLDGPGAGTTTTASSSTSFPITGTDTNIGYFASGVQRSTDTFRIEKPDAKGISKYSARGKCTGGTRSHKTVKCTYTASGTVDTNPGGVARIKVVGTYTK